MNNLLLLRIAGYVWTAFGVGWVGFNVVRKAPGAGVRAPAARITVLAIAFVVLFWERQKIPPALLLVFGLAWAAAALYWSCRIKAVQSGEFKWYRPLRLLVLAATFALLFWDATGIGFLGKRFLPRTTAFAWLGFTLLLIGVGITLWARIVLGQYWSDRVIVQAGHQLIRSGPYAHMRHPIYSGVLLGVLGTALVLGEWRGLLGFALLLTNYIIKANREERILADQFRDQFDQHMSHAGFLLPRLRSR
jgi:protein-S-isoprenylcysteine O-methyltransferase Ste14